MARRYKPGALLHNAVRNSRAEFFKIQESDNIPSALLIIVYAVGLFFLLLNIYSGFIYLTPFTLLFSMGVVLYAHPKWDWRLPLLLLISFGTGMAVEIVGVQTGDIFGYYEYGEVLGPKWQGTPWAIGLNWAMLTYCCGATVIHFTPYWNRVGRALLGAFLMLSLDILIEPVAIMRGFWSWGIGGDGDIPLQNYVAWFAISFLLLCVFNMFYKNLENKAAITLFSLQFIFFFLLGAGWW